MTSSTSKYKRRTRAEIIGLLKDKEANKYTTAAFCSQHGISHQTFYNWKKEYGAQPSPANDFIALPGLPAVHIDPAPFCEVVIGAKTTIRFFGAVNTKYLKSLIS